MKCLNLVMPQLGGQRTSSLLLTGFSYGNLLVLGTRHFLLFVHRIDLNTDGCNIYNLRKDKIITKDYIHEHGEVHAFFLQHPY